ncbi:MAG: hypothetical protein WD048_14330 [Chitinophagales bacterium]
MIRSIFSVIAAALVGYFVIALLEAIIHQVTGISASDQKNFKLQLAEIPKLALLFIWSAYILGSITAGAVAAVLCRKYQIKAAAFSGLLLLLAGFINLYMIPHPTWFIIGTTITYVPFAVIGGNYGKNIKDKNVI